jgi:hypothetical protein
MREWNTALHEVNLPIYVGKAVPTGGRKGLVQNDSSHHGTA